jgi:ABC-type multidrug transport system ATPase subunit
MIRTERLAKVIDGRAVLSEITLSVEKGDAIAIGGLPRPGKSTLLRILATLMRPTSGRVEIAGIDAAVRPFDARKRVFLSDGVAPGCHDMTVREYLQLIAATRAPNTRRSAANVAPLIALLQLDAAKSVNMLTSCERRLVEMAAAIGSQAEVLLFNEPLTGLDGPALECCTALMSDARVRGAAILATVGADAPPSPIWNRQIHLEEVGA